MRDQEFIGLYGAYHQICESSVIFEDEMEGNPLLSLTYDRRAKRLKDKAEKIRRKGGKTRTEETDLFDTILEHLVSEGYADTNESALVIMANMSEEWRQSIVETIWYGKSGFNPPVAQQRRLGPEVGASGGFSVLAKKGGVEGMKQLMPPGQGKDKWHPGKWTPEGRKRHEDQKNKSPNLLGRIVNTVYKDK